MTHREILHMRKQIAEIVALAICDLPPGERLERMRSGIVAAANVVIAKRPDVTLDDMHMMLIEDRGGGPIGDEILAMLGGMVRSSGNVTGKA